MTRPIPGYALCVLLLAPVVGAGCTQGGLEFSLDATTTLQDAGAGSRPDRSAPDAATDVASTEVSTLSLTLNTTELEVGQRVSIEVSARTDANQPVEDVSLQWHVSPESIATVEAPGLLEALAEGQAQVWASAGAVESNRLDISVAAAGAGATRYVLVEPRQIALAPGQSFSLLAQVRRLHGEVIEGLQVRWESSDEALVTVDDSGTITAVAPGRAEVSAVVDNSEPLPVQVRVTEAPTWLRAQIVRPSAPVAARGEPIEVDVDLREVAVGAPDRLGTPLQPDSVEITFDGSSVGQADIDWDGARFTLDTADLAEGLHRLGARVQAGGESYEAPTRMVWVDAPAPAFADHWENLHGSEDGRWALDDDIGATNGNAPALAIDSQGTIYVAFERPNRGESAELHVYKWSDDEGRWRALRAHENNTNRHGLQLRNWSAQYEYFPSNTVQFVDLAIDDQDRPLLTFTQEAVDDGGNGDERQKRWFDTFVARYEDGFGPEGGAGWRLLTSGAQDYIVDPPRDAEPQHPPPADVDELDDVFAPQVLWDAQRARITALWTSAPFPREKTYLDVRIWSQATASWTTIGERLEIEGSVPELREAFFTPAGQLIAVVEDQAAAPGEGYAIWQLDLDQDRWTRLDAAGHLADIAALDDDAFVAANLSSGMLRGVSLRDGVASSGGPILNRSPWVAANHPAFVHRSDGSHAPALLWTEGAPGSRQWIYGAVHADAAWTPLDVELFTRTRGEQRLVAAVDPQGRLVIARQVPTDAGSDAPYGMLVVRSREALF